MSSSSPPIPDRQRNGDPSYNARNYTIVGNYKVAFPQWRLMRRSYPGDGETREWGMVFCPVVLGLNYSASLIWLGVGSGIIC